MAIIRVSDLDTLLRDLKAATDKFGGGNLVESKPTTGSKIYVSYFNSILDALDYCYNDSPNRSYILQLASAPVDYGVNTLYTNRVIDAYALDARELCANTYANICIHVSCSCDTYTPCSSYCACYHPCSCDIDNYCPCDNPHIPCCGCGYD